MRRRARRAGWPLPTLSALLVTALAGCATPPHPAIGPLGPAAVTGASHPAVPKGPAATAPLQARPATPLNGRIGYAAADLDAALAAFRASCPALARRSDASGLTQPGDWVAPCAAATTASDAHTFFATAFVAIRIGDGVGLDTGYYEPDLAASRTRSGSFATPLYRRPPDLADLDLGVFDAALAGRHIRGHIAGGKFVPYFDRAEIDAGALAGRGLEIAWAGDPYAAFFLEIQGSGRLRLRDGSTIRVGYDGQNGHAYTGIGKLLRDRGALGPGQATMAGIIDWMRAHPADGVRLMRENRSKIFFRVLATPSSLGPPGALGVPLTPRASVAADPAFVPLGAPLWLDTTVAGAPFRAIVVAQDTGGAIKGTNRLDLFWGSGDAAGAVAGGITATGSVTLLLPPDAARRVLHGPPPAP